MTNFIAFFLGASFINEPKLPITTFHTTDGSEPMTKRLCIEQNGHTYILALQGIVRVRRSLL